MDDDRELRKELATLEQDHAVLKQEMQTMYANYMTALERNERKMAELAADMERRDTKAAERENRLVFKIAAIVSLAVVILGFVMNLMIRTGARIRSSTSPRRSRSRPRRRKIPVRRRPFDQPERLRVEDKAPRVDTARVGGLALGRRFRKRGQAKFSPFAGERQRS